MAFGATKGTHSAAASTTAATNATSGSVAVAVGDLIYVVFGEQIALTASGVTDNLGNTYSAVNAGSDTGAVTARAFYSRVTVAGTLTAVTVAATSSTDNFVLGVAVIEGPFAAVTPLDAAPANDISDTLPGDPNVTTPATGTLIQVDEYVFGFGVADTASSNWTGVAPWTALVSEIAGASGIDLIIVGQVVSATTSVTPTINDDGGGTVVEMVLGTASFRKEVASSGMFLMFT